MLQRQTKIEVAAGVGPLVVMLAVFLMIGRTYTGEGGLTQTGGLAMTGAIVAFVLVMIAIGIGLSRSGYDEDDD